MFRIFKGFDWKKSNAHWLLLSKFLHPQNLENFAQSDIWESVLDEKPSQAIKRFLKEGLLEIAELENVLDYKYTVADLKKILTKYGLPVSGQKNDLIKRLTTTEYDSMKKATEGLTVLICTRRGRELSGEYLANEKINRSKTETQVLEYIKNRMFQEAVLAVVAFEAKQVFPRGMGIDWKNHNTNHELEIINIIFSSKPKILSKMRDDNLEFFRQGAALMLLWGTNTTKHWLPPDLSTEITLDVDTVARMFLFHAIFKKSLARYYADGRTKYVEILIAQGSCEECKKYEGVKFRLDEVPELPHEKCTHEKGCRCSLITARD